MNRLKFVLTNTQAEGISGMEALKSALCVIAVFLIPCFI